MRYMPVITIIFNEAALDSSLTVLNTTVIAIYQLIIRDTQTMTVKAEITPVGGQ
jgi:hypothetical protein